MNPDTSLWTKIGDSPNAEFFEVEPHVLAVVPIDGTADDERTARESIRIQLEYLRARKTRAGTIVYMDRVVAQDAGARQIYRQAPDPALQVCFALVGGTAFGRAVGSVFLGISKPPIPTRMFATGGDALAWVRLRVHAV